MDCSSETLRDARREFVEAMSRAAFSVSVVTTDGAAGKAGMTVSAMSSVSADPPSMLVCVHRQSRFAGLVEANGCFAISLLAEGQSKIADVFAGRTDCADRFAEASWRQMKTGAPVILSAAATFDLKLIDTVTVGTHDIVVGQVCDMGLASECPPLVHYRRGYKRLWLDSRGPD